MHKKIEQWEGSNPTGSQQAHPSGALHHLLRLYRDGAGGGLWVGGKRYGYSDGERRGLQMVIFTVKGDENIPSRNLPDDNPHFKKQIISTDISYS